MRGLKVVLIERNDLAFGASGNSSGLIHGGPRYLTSDPNVTYTSCLDSGYIQRIAPHLLFRIPVIVPVTKQPGSRLELDLLDAFFGAYDRFQPLKRGKPHTRLSGDELRRLEPGLVGEFEGGVTFDEWGIDGARLCVANALDAERHGARVWVPVTVTRFLREANGRVSGVGYQDRVDGRSGELRARWVVNATGAWAPLTTSLGGVRTREARVRPGKGIHDYFDRRLSNYGIMVKAIDGRRVFIEPWQTMSVLGTTDDDFYGDLDEVRATTDEVRYLFEAIGRVFPAIHQARALGTWAGVRPTLYEWGKHEDALSREHTIVDHTAEGMPGLFSMVGGKLASYRLFAQEMSDRLTTLLGAEVACSTHLRPLPGGEEVPAADDIAATARIDALSAARLVYRHGARARQLAERMAQNPQERELVCSCEPVTCAEVRHAVEAEWAFDVEGVARRTRLGLGSCGGLRCAGRCGALVAEARGESAAHGRRMACEFLGRQAERRASVVGPAGVRHEMLLRQHWVHQFGFGGTR